MPPLRSFALALTVLASVQSVPARAGLDGVSPQGQAGHDFGGLSEADAERLVAGYLALWSDDRGVTPATVSTFYAPHVVYYGKSFSRTQVLDDKLAYIRHWPVRHYREVPGSLSAHCDARQSVCRVSFIMSWRRVSRLHRVSTGRARVAFDFVPVEGRRKIARESARIL